MSTAKEILQTVFDEFWSFVNDLTEEEMISVEPIERFKELYVTWRDNFSECKFDF
jgi:hypothetical protein